MAAAVSVPPLDPADSHPSVVSQDHKPLTDADNRPSSASHSPQLETLAASPAPVTAPAPAPAPAPSLPPFVNSIDKLKDLCDSISAFQQSFDDLRNHLDSIKDSIFALLPQETPEIAPPPAPSSPRHVASDQLEGMEGNPPKSELGILCKNMCSRDVRKYLASHLSDVTKLREEVPKALKLAPNPPKLVLECLGKFFLQGSKAFTKDSPMIPAREASILTLECYLLMMGLYAAEGKGSGGVNIDKALKEEAEAAALAWRKRLIVEGGLASASQIDARGLLLFVSCFGVPAAFKKEDFRDLVIAGNAKEIMGVLKNSHILMNKIPEIVEWMINNKMEVYAVDIAYSFGLEEKFNPQTILTTFLRESYKKSKKGPQASAAANNEANKKLLAALRSVAECLGRHKIDPVIVLPEWQLNEKIATLEKEIPESGQKSVEKTASKRKSSEAETSKKSRNQEAKRSRYTGHGPQQQKPTGADGRRKFQGNRFPNHSKTYSAPSTVVYGGPGASLPPGYGVQGGVLVDTTAQLINHGNHPYLWHADSAINERYATAQPGERYATAQPGERYAAAQPSSVALSSLYNASPSMEGYAGVPGASSIRGSASAHLYQFADSIGESVSHPSSSVVRGAGSAVPTAVPPYLYQA